jgi:transposase
MQSYHWVHVQLGSKDRRQLTGMLAKGKESARVLRRASILLQLDRGQKSTQVAANVGVAAKTVRAVARRYEDEGMEWELNEKSRTGKQRAMDTGQSKRIIAMFAVHRPREWRGGACG